MDQTDWRLLRSIYKNHTTLKAAESLFISQPAVSYRMRKMEEEFGQKLFLRSSTGVSLNDKGQILLNYANQMLSTWEQIYASVRSDSPELSGSITIGCTPNFFRLHLIHQLRDFCDHYPEISVTIATHGSNVLSEKLRSKELPVCIIRGIPQMKWNGISRQLVTDPLCIVSTSPISEEYLRTHPVVINHKDYPVNALITSWLVDHFGCIPEQSHITIMGDSQSILSAVEQGFGWAVITASRIKTDSHLYRQNIYSKSGEPLICPSTLYVDEKSLIYTPYAVYLDHLVRFCSRRNE